MANLPIIHGDKIMTSNMRHEKCFESIQHDAVQLRQKL